MAKPPRKGSGTEPPEQSKTSPPPARRYGVRDVGSLLPDVGGMAFRRFGFVQAALLARWREVVGPVYARWSIPESLKFARGETTGGVLTIRVEGPLSIQLQHVGPQIIDRANRILGHAAVGRIRLVQGEVPKPADRPALPQAARGPAPSGLANLSGVKDEGLRSALEELAAQIGTAKGPPKIG
jgi:hypothetical protein